MQPTLQPPTGCRPSWAELEPAGQKIGRRENPQRKQEVNNPGTKSIQVNIYFLAPSSVSLVKGVSKSPPVLQEPKLQAVLSAWLAGCRGESETQRTSPRLRPPNS